MNSICFRDGSGRRPILDGLHWTNGAFPWRRRTRAVFPPRDKTAARPVSHRRWPSTRTRSGALAAQLRQQPTGCSCYAHDRAKLDGDGHRHLQGFGRSQGKANVLPPQRCGEACRLEFAAGDQPAIGFINRRRKQGRGQQTDIAEKE